MNIIFRRCLAMLDLVLMRRDYFDPVAAEVVPVCYYNKIKKTE